MHVEYTITIYCCHFHRSIVADIWERIKQQNFVHHSSNKYNHNTHWIKTNRPTTFIIYNTDICQYYFRWKLVGDIVFLTIWKTSLSRIVASQWTLLSKMTLTTICRRIPEVFRMIFAILSVKENSWIHHAAS